MNPRSRLKVKGDTVYLPDAEGGVYFRNNSGSFRMTGSMMDRWIEKLFPIFNGEHTMEELTDGLPVPHRNRVYEIGESLMQNGFVRDVSEDSPHRLPDEVLRKFAAQIEFLDNLDGSGAYRFQCYRQAKVLAVGSGSFGVSLAAALLESGLPAFHLLWLDAEPAHRQRVSELADYARLTDPNAAIEELAVPKQETIPWRDVISPFDWILYVSEETGIPNLRALHQVCLEQRKVLLPAIFVRQTGIAGPLVSPDSDGCWESAWRRLHQAAITRDAETHPVSSIAQSMLANVCAFELFKAVTGASGLELQNQLFLLNLETLEGSRHSFVPHPLVSGIPEMKSLHEPELRMDARSDGAKSNELLPWLSRLTSQETGIFHVWDEGDIVQLPLSVCRVQAVDPLSEGPCELLPELVCGDLTHEEARREAGLAGIEAYAARLNPTTELMGVGAGQTEAEGIWRGLHHLLIQQLSRQFSGRRPVLYPIRLTDVQDVRIPFYLRSLTAMQGEPIIAAGEDVAGFPVMWIGTSRAWYAGVGFNRASALRHALLTALMKWQIDDSANIAVRGVEASSVILADYGSPKAAIASSAESRPSADLEQALQIIKRSGQRLAVHELGIEPFLKEGLVGVFGVSLREEESP